MRGSFSKSVLSKTFSDFSRPDKKKHSIRPHEVLCIVAGGSGMNVSDAQNPRPSPDSILLDFMNELRHTDFGGSTDRYRYRGAGRRREVDGERMPRRGRASAERMLRATREARCDLPTCSEPKGWPTAPAAPGGLDLVFC